MKTSLGLHLLFSCVCAFNLDTLHPIIYEDVARNWSLRQTYFGYTVLLSKAYSSVVIGAPRSNSTFLPPDKVIEPGVVYVCKYIGPCDEILLDYRGNEKPASTKTSNIWDLKDYAWIGGAMDIEQKNGGRLVICAPRWVNQFYKKTRSEYLITGLCYYKYYEDFERPATRLTPTTSEADSLFKPHWSSVSVYYYGMSQAGMSVHLTPDKEDVGMILGAPGLLNWRGGVVEYPDIDVYDPQGRNKRATDSTWKRFSSNPRVINPYYSLDTSDFDYCGYQVSSGHFFDKEQHFYAITCPRGSTFMGYVMIISFPTNIKPTSGWIYYDKKLGQEFGEYFGYSIAVADITGDGYDDLVIGAPFYSNRGKHAEIGRVHVFHGSSLYTLQVPSAGGLIEGTGIGGRFGSAVASLGDINQDGYQDIAVGAPYEDERLGAIYIYNGSPRGLKPNYGQRILASEIDLTLRGFGNSISPPDDMDGNYYEDVAVGSFLSGHAVLLRTYPVIKLHLTVVPDVSSLRIADTQFNVRICQRYSGRHSPPTINVTRSLVIDEKLKRAGYDNKEKKVELWHDDYKCEIVPVFLNVSDENLEAITIRVKQDLVPRTEKRNAIWIKPNSSLSVEDTFCKSCPVLEEDSVKEMRLSLPYVTDCGPCRSNLQLSCDLIDVASLKSLNGEYVLGSEKIIRLVMNITNHGEASYGTFVAVDLVEGVNIGNLPTDCYETPIAMLVRIVCEIRRPLRHLATKKLSLDLDMSYMEQAVDMQTGLAPNFVISVQVNSSSIEQYDADNFVNVTLKIKTEADFVMFGKSRDEQYSYIKKENKEEQALEITFGQIYQAFKFGRSPVYEMQVMFSVPILWTSKDIRFLSLYQPEGKLNEQPVKCTSDSDDLTFISRNTNVQSDGGDDLEQEPQRKKRSVEAIEATNYSDTSLDGMGFNLIVNNSVHKYPSDRSLYLNCSTPEVRCYTITCTATQVKVQSLELELTMVLDIASLEPLLKDKDIIHVATEARVSIEKPINMKHLDIYGPDYVMISSTIVGTLPEKKVELGITVLAVVLGCVVLVLLILGLVAAGFFRRKKRDELNELKNADNEFSTCEGSVQLVPPPEE